MAKRYSGGNAVRSKYGKSDITIAFRVTETEWLSYKAKAGTMALSKWIRKHINKASGLEK